MSGDMPWKEIFEWSMTYQGESTGGQPRLLPEEERTWLEEALKGAMVDLGKRLQDINETLAEGGGVAYGADEEAGAPLEEKERLLDELAELVESIDLARDLSTIGGLPTLLSLMGGSHASLRWRAAEVAAICSQNNPDVQAAFVQGGVLPALWPLLDDPADTCQVKGLLAVSCMVRGSPAALAWFRQQGGAAKLAEMAGREDARVQRKCLQVLHYVLQAAPGERAALCDGPRLLRRLAALLASEDGDIRAAALGVVGQLAASPASLHRLQQNTVLRQAVQALECRLDTLPEEDWPAAEEELALAKGVAAALAAPAGAAHTAGEEEGSTGSEAGGASGMQLLAVPQPQL